MYVVTNRVPVAEGWQEAFEERFARRVGRIEQNPGFIRMEVLRPDSADAPYVVQTLWEDEAAFQRWVGSEDFRAAHADPLPPEAYNGEAAMEKFEVVVAARREEG